MSDVRVVRRRNVTWSVSAPVNPTGWDFWAEYWEKDWEDATLDIVDRYVRPDATFLDVGAWIGPISLWGARHGPVVAVEPDPVALDFLTANCARNAEGARVTILEGALTEISGHVAIASHRGDFGNSETRVGIGNTLVRAWTIDEVFRVAQIKRCSMVKMDIEGLEGTLLPSVGPYLARRGIPLLVALHEPLWERPLDPHWCDDYAAVVTISEGGWGQVLALPYRRENEECLLQDVA